MSTALETHVPVSGYAVLREEGVLSSLGLGSCVALMLYDASTRVGGMAHVLLPHDSLSRDRARLSKFGNTAVHFLADEMRRHGAGTGLVARLAGGASMFGALIASGTNMGERNADALRTGLQTLGIPVLGEDVGGDYGRSVYFDVATGLVRTSSLRHGERYV